LQRQFVLHPTSPNPRIAPARPSFTHWKEKLRSYGHWGRL
jgi:hypothetical protein